jgi:hypothetical protein
MPTETLIQEPPVPPPAVAPRDGELLYRFEARLEVHPVGIVPEGLRMTIAFDGTLSGGVLGRHGFEGARVWGIDPLLLRPDGVGVIDAPKTISAPGRNLFEHLRGYCHPPAGLEFPPLEALRDPSFRWPDDLFAIHGFSTFRAGIPELAWLNRAHAVIDGWASMTRGRLAVETRLVEHRGSVAGPGATNGQG